MKCLVQQGPARHIDRVLIHCRGKINRAIDFGRQFNQWIASADRAGETPVLKLFWDVLKREVKMGERGRLVLEISDSKISPLQPEVWMLKVDLVDSPQYGRGV